jgi:gamma-glutamylaminecyclotransferase
MQKVFVYGTLMRGNTTRGLDQFSGAEFVNKALTVDASYSMYDLGSFPSVCIKGDQQIQGEVWEVDETMMKVLDGIEGYPNFYNRKLVNTTEGEAWMYYIPGIEKDKFANKIIAETSVAWTA